VNDEPLALTVPPELVEAIATRAAELALERLGGQNGSPWMTRAEAADYLGLPLSRLEKDRTIPVHKDGRRCLYHRASLDAHFRGS
jgi:excisionase family DNA binding protein